MALAQVNPTNPKAPKKSALEKFSEYMSIPLALANAAVSGYEGITKGQANTAAAEASKLDALRAAKEANAYNYFTNLPNK